MSELKKVNAKLWRSQGSYWHLCPGCDKMHPLPDTWTFNGNQESPTFFPSFLQQQGSPKVCHYHIVEGVIQFQPDCHHALKGTNVPMPDAPDKFKF